MPWQIVEHLFISATAERDHKLQLKPLTGLRNQAQDSGSNLPCRSQRRVYKWPFVEPIPRKFHKWSCSLIYKWPSVVEVRWQHRSWKIQAQRQLRYMRELGKDFPNLSDWPQAEFPPVFIESPSYWPEHAEDR